MLEENPVSGSAFPDGSCCRYKARAWPTAAILAAAIAIATAGCYWQIGQHEFVRYDDGDYIVGNRHVMEGLSWSGAKWAFTSFEASNWHPLTWLSHMLDVQLFGDWAGGHHLMSLAIHILSTLLLLWLLFYTTDRPWLAAMAAGLFALHPVHVESVAWASEKKDVLSTFFWFATMLAYAFYVRRPRASRYLAVVILLAMGLLSKPMLVTLPVVLLLLDYWPLCRFDLLRDGWKLRIHGTSARRLLLEKLPLLVMVAASCLMTLKAQSGAIAEFDVLGFWTRLANATISYGRYLWMMIWPANLAVFYPLVTKISYFQLVAAIPVLAAATILAFRLSGGRRYILVGWLWYIVTLVPVIGLVQVGSQSHADRYTYIPSVGIFLIAVWRAGELAGKSAIMRKVAVAAGLLALTAMGIMTHRQVAFWKEDLKLFTRAITVTKNNAGMLANAGVVLSERGYGDEGLSLLQEAARLQPNNVQIVMNLGSAFVDVGRFEEALECYRKAIELRPDFWDAQLGAATALAKLGRPDEADPYCRRALALAPDAPDVYNTMGMILVAKGKLDESIEAFTKAAAKFPGVASAPLNIARIYAVQGRLDDAIVECRKSIAMMPHQAAYDYLAELLEKDGQAGQAAAVCEEGLKKFPDDEDLLHRLERLALEQHREKNKPKDSGSL